MSFRRRRKIRFVASLPEACARCWRKKLLPARQGGRVALYELLVNTPAVANLIREGKVHQLPGVMQTGMQAGMLTFTQSFQQRVAAGAL